MAGWELVVAVASEGAAPFDADDEEHAAVERSSGTMRSANRRVLRRPNMNDSYWSGALQNGYRAHSGPYDATSQGS